jgi:hypothetical protein
VGASLYSLVFSRMLAKKAGGKRMANQEHLDTLLLGVTTWKDWKKQNPAICIYPHLSDANLGQGTEEVPWPGTRSWSAPSLTASAALDDPPFI